MNIGKLNKRITFLKMLSCLDEMGQETEKTWQEVKTVWAYIKPLRGKEFWDAKKINAEQTYKITTRYYKDITTDMCIRYENKTMKIESVANVEEGNKMLEIICTENIEQGGTVKDG